MRRFVLYLWLPRGQGEKQEHQVGASSSLDGSSGAPARAVAADMDGVGLSCILEVKPIGQVDCVWGMRTQEETSKILGDF